MKNIDFHPTMLLSMPPTTLQVQVFFQLAFMSSFPVRNVHTFGVVDRVCKYRLQGAWQVVT